jgi:hypothetical protein
MALLLQNWWTTTLPGATYPKGTPLESDVQCDVLVVGGGMAGINAAMATCYQKAARGCLALHASACPFADVPAATK